ncbi:hypothetical protein A2797_02665 [candidate division WWE3 bacterium RIFCSPHIGHO2_01_FULL_48_15]|uniref:Uncharacterized protein n=1 Tax=candidate division WWE3 bacterium RIFCSPHIGHO2_01_FULL_48_15 TaxID=1802619 RepID=A0A1F4VA82_UNCKA|nr:MAG: hypothetical protein A2797_02665 [candidate division WWE3 bacterium RIFCSPHIGHO2_01_FULL_48_15]
MSQQEATDSTQVSQETQVTQAPPLYELRSSTTNETIERIGAFNSLFVAGLTVGKADIAELTVGGTSLEEIIKGVISNQQEAVSEEPKDGIFETLTATIQAVFENLTAKTAQIAEAVVGKLTVKKLEVSGGLQLTAEETKPECTEETRGTVWFTEGAVSEKDIFEVCAKDENDIYAWTTP